MTTIYKQVARLKPVDAAYIAGLIDGEGTISLSRKHRNENRHIVVSISNTERELLEYVLESVGAGKITSKKTTKAHHTPSFAYTISNRQALDLLSQITPYLRTHKKQRAELALKKYIELTPRNGYYTPEMLKQREKFIQAFFSILPITKDKDI